MICPRRYAVYSQGFFSSGKEYVMFRKSLQVKPAAFILPILLLAALLSGCPGPTDPAPTPTPDPPAKPVITSVVPASAVSLTVTWGAATGAAYYEVYYAETGNEIPATAAISNISTGSTTVSSLTSATVYNVWVKAVNEQGSAVSDPWTTAVYDPAPLAAIKGTWVSSYGEEYIISGTEFISAYAGATSYKGSIVNIRTDDADSKAGYITIRYTQEPSWYPGAAGNYYVIRWENWTADSTIKISTAYNDTVTGKGYGTVAEAENEYTGSIGSKPFQGASDCYFTAVESKPSAIVGTWKNKTYGDSYTITDKLVIYAPSGYTTFVGEIVNIRTLPDDTNYITFKYITNDTPYLEESLVGKYCVLYWTKFVSGDTSSVKIATAYSSSAPGDEGKDTQQAAETEYTIDDEADYFSDLYEFTPPSY
jgi:hypothetical protein